MKLEGATQFILGILVALIIILFCYTCSLEQCDSQTCSHPRLTQALGMRLGMSVSKKFFRSFRLGGVCLTGLREIPSKD